jgi:hypothetical protein
MLVMQITQDDLDPAHTPPDGLFAFLTCQGIPSEVILRALDQLRRIKTLTLCKSSEETEWEIREE